MRRVEGSADLGATSFLQGGRPQNRQTARSWVGRGLLSSSASVPRGRKGHASAVQRWESSSWQSLHVHSGAPRGLGGYVRRRRSGRQDEGSYPPYRALGTVEVGTEDLQLLPSHGMDVVRAHTWMPPVPFQPLKAGSHENRRLVLQCMLRRIRVYGNISFQPNSIARRLCKGPNCERLGERAKTGPARARNPAMLLRTALQP